MDSTSAAAADGGAWLVPRDSRASTTCRATSLATCDEELVKHVWHRVGELGAAVAVSVTREGGGSLGEGQEEKSES